MLRFFRQIRQKLIDSGSVTKYMFYAIGEILLVVVGILIALQVNNWNEEKQLQKNELSYLMEIRENLVADTQQIDGVLAFNEKKTELIESVIDTLLSDADQVDIALYLQSTGHILLEFEIFYPTSIAFENMINAESISLIQDQQLRNSLSLHYSESDLNSGTQDRLKEVTRNYSDLIVPVLNRKELIEREYSKSSELPSVASFNLKGDPNLFASLRFMAAVMNAQNTIMVTEKLSTQNLMNEIDGYLDISR